MIRSLAIKLMFYGYCVGPLATIRCKPRQARKGATVAADSCAGMRLAQYPPKSLHFYRLVANGLSGSRQKMAPKQFLSTSRPGTRQPIAHPRLAAQSPASCLFIYRNTRRWKNDCRPNFSKSHQLRKSSGLQPLRRMPGVQRI
jgi:hypothetical protein